MIRIENRLILARKAATGWGVARANEFARGLKFQSSAVMDWDEGAGESWVRLIVDDAVVAYISVILPLVILCRGAMRLGEPDPRVQEIVVETMENRELSTAKSALEAAFGASPRLDTFDAEGFSADELWYATV